MSAIIDTLRDALLQFSVKQLTFDNVITVVSYAMKLAKQYGSLSGVEKHAYVVEAVKAYAAADGRITPQEQFVIDIIEKHLPSIVQQLYRENKAAYKSAPAASAQKPPKKRRRLGCL